MLSCGGGGSGFDFVLIGDEEASLGENKVVVNALTKIGDGMMANAIIDAAITVVNDDDGSE